MEKYTYLILNILTLVGPLALSFEKNVHFYRKWKFYFPSLIITAVFFLVWDHYKTVLGVWSFNPKYLIGISFWNLPLEEYLFFFTVPYACAFIYEAVSFHIRKRVFSSNLNLHFWILSAICMLASFLVVGKLYTWSVLFLVSIALPLLTLVLKDKKLESFLLAYLIALLPMIVVNGILTALPVVQYNDAENLGIRTVTIPIEDYLYNMILLAMNIGLYQWFTSFSLNTDQQPTLAESF